MIGDFDGAGPSIGASPVRVNPRSRRVCGLRRPGRVRPPAWAPKLAAPARSKYLKRLFVRGQSAQLATEYAKKIVRETAWKRPAGRLGTIVFQLTRRGRREDEVLTAMRDCPQIVAACASRCDCAPAVEVKRRVGTHSLSVLRPPPLCGDVRIHFGGRAHRIGACDVRALAERAISSIGMSARRTAVA